MPHAGNRDSLGERVTEAAVVPGKGLLLFPPLWSSGLFELSDRAVSKC